MTSEVEVLACPHCGGSFSRRLEIDIEDEVCPYCGFNYKTEEPDDAKDRTT